MEKNAFLGELVGMNFILFLFWRWTCYGAALKPWESSTPCAPCLLFKHSKLFLHIVIVVVDVLWDLPWKTGQCRKVLDSGRGSNGIELAWTCQNGGPNMASPSNMVEKEPLETQSSRAPTSECHLPTRKHNLTTFSVLFQHETSNNMEFRCSVVSEHGSKLGKPHMFHINHPVSWAWWLWFIPDVSSLLGVNHHPYIYIYTYIYM